MEIVNIKYLIFTSMKGNSYYYYQMTDLDIVQTLLIYFRIRSQILGNLFVSLGHQMWVKKRIH